MKSYHTRKHYHQKEPAKSTNIGMNRSENNIKGGKVSSRTG